MDALQYTRLDPSKKQIRLLKLISGEWDEQVRCELYVVSLDDQIKYEALSYVWGSPRDLVGIDVNGSLFSATQNLHAALRRLREQIRDSAHAESNGDSRVLWVDAVCINQQDAQEKRHQVELMGDIYSRTTRGLLWLGEEPDEPQPIVTKEQDDEVARLLQVSGNFLDELSASLPHLDFSQSLSPMPEVKFRPGVHDFKITRTRAEHWDPQFDPESLDDAGKLALEADSFYQVDCLLTTLSMGTHLRDIPHLQHEPEDAPATFRTNTRQALHWLATRAWWSRIWTVQECIWPKDSELLYGPIRIPWRRFLTAISNFQRHRTSCCADVLGVNDMLNPVVENVLPCLILHRYCHNEDFNPSKDLEDHDDPFDVSSLFRPESLLWTFRYREATDPKDKIYGILSLLKGNSTITEKYARTFIVPDYSSETTYEKVFTKAVFSIMQFSASLDITCQPGHAPRDLNSRLSSWVPDFSQPLTSAWTLDRYLRQFPCYDACARRSVSPSVIEDNILVLEGCLVDTIESTSSRMVSQDYEPQRSVLRDWYTFAKDLHHGVSDSDGDSSTTDWKERFWRTICGDTIMIKQKGLLQDEFKAQLKKIPPALSSAIGPTHEETAYNLWCQAQGLEDLGTRQLAMAEDNSANSMSGYSIGSVAYVIKISAASRRMFSSTKGRLGLCPPMSGLTYPEKDRIFVLPGMRHLIGDCYLDGYMDGEGMKDFETKKQTVYIV
ncbi:heterokaryon incompatibility protein-domain-containing protein [Xylariaceae sp. AK1471]|nr:heterokaryon incompatibility protein-domain-containing protein [Xylariaceae sp. AK1471]